MSQSKPNMQIAECFQPATLVVLTFSHESSPPCSGFAIFTSSSLTKILHCRDHSHNSDSLEYRDNTFSMTRMKSEINRRQHSLLLHLMDKPTLLKGSSVLQVALDFPPMLSKLLPRFARQMFWCCDEPIRTACLFF